MSTAPQSVWVVKFLDRMHRNESHLNVMAVDVVGAVKAAKSWLSDDYAEVEDAEKRVADYTITAVTHLAEIHWPKIAIPGDE